MDFYRELEERGLVKQTTAPEIEKIINQKQLTVYAGFDPTGDSLHVGSLMPLLLLRRFQLQGHRVIAVVGGATGMIGDPSGKSTERSLLDEATLDRNLKGITKDVSGILNLKGNNPALVVNNFDWFRDFSFQDFLRDVGKHFTVNHMLAKDSVKQRLEDRNHGISYTEFSYMLLQAYDFYHLNKHQHCTLQIGGSDQWGNITAGCELIRRMKSARGESSEEVFGLTFPLITKADGSKYGKSEKGAVWLNPEKTSPYDFFQFFIQTSDQDVMNMIRYFTFLPLEEIGTIEKEFLRSPETRLAQKTLAREMTKLVHGEEELHKVEATTSALFSGDLTTLDLKGLRSFLKDAPSIKKSLTEIKNGFPLVDALVESGLCSSKGAAKKDIASGGIYVNQVRVTDSQAQLSASDLLHQEVVVLRKGKKNYFVFNFGK